jgi:hypothetical protein
MSLHGNVWVVGCYVPVIKKSLQCVQKHSCPFVLLIVL